MNHIVNFSGGKDSTAMLLRMIELNMPIDKIIYFDCENWEFPEMVRHISKVEKYIKRKIIRLKLEKNLDWWFFQYMPKKTKYTNTGKAFPRMFLRWCTALKRDRLRKFQNQYKPFEDYIGFAYDEQHRAKPHLHLGKIENYPLIEWKWTEKKCLEYCYDKGFHWEGLYNYFNRVSCWCCPLQKINDLRMLYNYFPHLWQRLLYMQKKSWNTFRTDATVFDLDRRFTEEKKQLKMNFATVLNKLHL